MPVETCVIQPERSRPLWTLGDRQDMAMAWLKNRFFGDENIAFHRAQMGRFWENGQKGV